MINQVNVLLLNKHFLILVILFLAHSPLKTSFSCVNFKRKIFIASSICSQTRESFHNKRTSIHCSSSFHLASKLKRYLSFRTTYQDWNICRFFADYIFGVNRMVVKIEYLKLYLTNHIFLLFISVLQLQKTSTLWSINLTLIFKVYKESSPIFVFNKNSIVLFSLH